MPSARDRLGSGVIGDLFVVAGGAYWEKEQKHYHSETIAYSRKTDKWMRLPQMPRSGAYGASAVIRDRRGNEQLLIAGGANESKATAECFRLLRQKGKLMWKRLPSLPRPLAGASGAVIGRSFYVFGGAPGMDEAGFRSARPALLVLEFDERLEPIRGWREIKSLGTPCARVGAAVDAYGKKLFVFGGYGVQPDGTLGNFGDAYLLDASRTTTWKRIEDMPIRSRWTTAVALDDQHVGLFGGYGEGFLDKSFIYDIETDAYSTSAPIPRPTAVMASGHAKDGTVYLAGGEDEMRHRSASFFIGRPKPD